MLTRVFRGVISLLVALCVVAAGDVLLAGPASAATSAIEQRYNSDAALRKMLGAPTGVEYSVAGGRAKSYKWGTLYWSPSTGVHEVHGAIRYRYQQLGGPAGRLGFPTTDEGRVYVRYDIPEEVPPAGARNDFTNGALIWMASANKAFWISKTFADATPYDLYPYWYGIDTDELQAGKDSRMFDTGGLIMYQTTKGFFEVSTAYHLPNDILETYRETGIHTGFLGVPTGDVKSIDAGPNGVRAGLVQQFKGGRIYQCGLEWEELCGFESAQAFEVHGAILWKFDSVGGLSKLGYPVSNELGVGGGRISYFEKGSIFWNSTTEKTTVTYY